MKRKPAAVLLVLSLAVLALVLASAAVAAKGGNPGKGGGGGNGPTASGGNLTSGCTANAPRASASNTWAWGAPGSWGMPGQQLSYHILVVNDDVGCSSSSFVVSVSGPDGFSVSVPTSAISLNSGSMGYLWAYVTSPSGVADGNYPLTVSVSRAGSASPTAASSSTYYKVYSSDGAAPTMSWSNPSDGATISGRSYGVVGAFTDDHAVRKIDLYLDNVYMSTTLCDNLSYECRLYYKWAIRKVRGQHTATFNATDWMGNVASQTATFTVN